MTVINDAAGLVLPRHIAFIMDGNGRWAKKRGLPRTMGHRQGSMALRRVAMACSDLGIEAVSVYAFSTENWTRPKGEVSALMGMIGEYFGIYAGEIINAGIKVRFMGDLSALPSVAAAPCARLAEQTRNATGMTLNIGLNYGGRAEIVRAARTLAGRVAAGELSPDDIDEAMLGGALYTAGLPEVDLVVRTAGEKRLSGFMLWQTSYAEILVMDKYWPDMDKQGVLEAIREYSGRTRRFGGLAPEEGQ